jgi:hypothetical protein
MVLDPHCLRMELDGMLLCCRIYASPVEGTDTKGGQHIGKLTASCPHTMHTHFPAADQDTVQQRPFQIPSMDS